MERVRGFAAGNQSRLQLEHVEELVIHWMMTGRLDDSFARTSHGVGGWRHASPLRRTDLSGARSIAELAVHRESLERVLMDHPQSLQVILDALLDALRQEIAVEAEPVSRREAEGEEEKELCAVSIEPEF
jgi:hypothetical protein